MRVSISKMSAKEKLKEAAESQEEVDALEALAKEEKEFNKVSYASKSIIPTELTHLGR